MHAPAVLAADYAQTLDLAETSGLVGRGTAQTGPGASSTATAYGVDAIVQPRAHIAMSDRRWLFDVRDAAILTLPDLENGLGCAACSTPSASRSFTTHLCASATRRSYHDIRFLFALVGRCSGELATGPYGILRMDSPRVSCDDFACGGAH